MHRKYICVRDAFGHLSWTMTNNNSDGRCVCVVCCPWLLLHVLRKHVSPHAGAACAFYLCFFFFILSSSQLSVYIDNDDGIGKVYGGCRFE